MEYTYEEFKKLAEEAVDSKEADYRKYHTDYFRTDYYNDKGDFIIQEYTTGGAEGGNCWGEEAQWFSNEEPMEEFYPIDYILKAVKPDISYLDYKQIEKLFEIDNWRDSEYYGNYTDKILRKINLKKLYEFLS